MLAVQLRRVLAVSTLSLTVVLAPPVAAQCPGGDNLDGPCCQVAQLNIPPMPNFSLPALGICWDDCAPTTNGSQVNWSAPVQTMCGQFLSAVEIADPLVGVPVLVGDATLDYTRTWEEFDTVSLERRQVWRFAVKVNLFGGAPGFTPCPRPPCVDLFQMAFFYGYVDWALDCNTGLWSNATMLFHNCDLFIHNTLSAQPGFSHPTTTYGVVAPHTTANPFVPSITFPAPSGALVAEAVRKKNLPGTVLCTTEERVVGGSLIPLAYGCLCGGSTAFQQSANFLSGASFCGSAFDSLFIPSTFPTVPWIHMVSTSIGSWSTTATYPGPESVFANEGLFRYADGCTGDLSIEIYYGATTTDGVPVVTPGLTQNFVDIVDNYSQPVSGTPSLPLVGVIHPTDHLIYVNVP